MNGLIDVHCHILPEVDDGARTIQETVKMLGAAYRNGIRTFVFTPHYHPGRYKPEKAEIQKQFERVERIANQASGEIKVYLGQEIYYQQDTLELLEAGKVLTLAGSSYVLIEFSTRITFLEMKKGFQTLAMGGYVPILAHVERYECLMEDTNLVKNLVEIGVYIQTNADAILKGGYRIKRNLKDLMKNNLIHLVATDAHQMDTRPPEMKNTYRYIEKKFGRSYADELMIENPERIIRNEYI